MFCFQTDNRSADICLQTVQVFIHLREFKPGITEDTVDLRKVLPSNFLRPCALHGWIVRGKENSYDFDERIACVVRMDIDLPKKMLGNGELISMENFFPNENIDQGYKILLARQERSRINTKYDKILPDGIIADLK